MTWQPEDAAEINSRVGGEGCHRSREIANKSTRVADEHENWSDRRKNPARVEFRLSRRSDLRAEKGFETRRRFRAAKLNANAANFANFVLTTLIGVRAQQFCFFDSTLEPRGFSAPSTRQLRRTQIQNLGCSRCSLSGLGSRLAPHQSQICVLPLGGSRSEQLRQRNLSTRVLRNFSSGGASDWRMRGSRISGGKVLTSAAAAVGFEA